MKSALCCLLLVSATLVADDYDEAVNLINEARYEVAEALLLGIQQKRDSPKVRYALGFCAEKLGRSVEAVDYYKQAIALNLRTSEDADAASYCWQRLTVLRPAISIVTQRAFALHELAMKAEGAERAFLEEASEKLYAYALRLEATADGTVPAAVLTATPAPAPPPPTPVADKPKTVEEALGYKLKVHPIGAQRHGLAGHYYKFFDEAVTWEQAKARCKEMGGYLATIASDAENAFVKKQFDRQHCWIGAETSNGQWVWITGEDFTYSKWGSTQTLTQESFLRVFMNIHGTWSFYPSRGSEGPTHGFICEWEK